MTWDAAVDAYIEASEALSALPTTRPERWAAFERFYRAQVELQAIATLKQLAAINAQLPGLPGLYRERA